MSALAACFSHSYAEARAKFLAAVAHAGLAVQSHVHPLKGRDGEELAMDVVRDGPTDARRLLIISSACHGVEGYCGSGVQVASLADAELRQRAHAAGVAILYVHALNPHGFSHIRRVTQEGVDLNRNFHDFSQPLPVNAAYREIAHLLVPDEWPPTAASAAEREAYIRNHGEKAWQAAVSSGQHEFPDGLFFGGTAPTWSNLTIRQVLREHGARVPQLSWIDIHTGLGPSGLGERIYAGRDDAAEYARAVAWWGGNGKTPITSIYNGSSSSAFLTGLMWMSVYQECPQVQYTGIAMEYGTVPVMQGMEALRADHWLQLHPEAPAELAAQIHQKVMDAFYTDTDEWKQQILSQARESMLQAIDGLAGS